MNYMHFDFVVEEMSEADAAAVMEEIHRAVIDEKRLHMGGGYAPMNDADLTPRVLIVQHLRGIWDEIAGLIDAWFDRVLRTASGLREG